ncbi:MULTISPECIES: radical SAM family heme chaperone HemW [Brachybacterium]|uniref:Heme chaperone HemW n=2 Tax=Brachybacterium TaxID=43668 RepID=A0A426SMX5_9MICO|nr:MULTISPECIES: radical SAM family heme chaperone HemW [Brachybacterium]MDV3294461.1 radical SAM family heme chaperone HemW [Brachybacterium paraconglomeratum]RRR19585.1 coproporphyrinogen III oxidase [Brachybacterium paraconglomeratum]GLI31252.1 coproporphyrinogen III oxidase [Brachybacterium conglomeratum]GLK04164.1 coproporphyrinogen III oxidase [Brachybacterium conglomeratum]HJF49465.1 radical SAM family heme chaperone HemW [Brachybacterium paraconglomeratum]
MTVVKDLSAYIHVPFCAVRCGYCDFNTYTNAELGGGGSQAEYADNAMAEMDLTLAADRAAGYEYEEISTVFFGGGTPTLLPADDLVRMLDHLRSLIPLADDAEVTTEANPDSVTRASLSRLADGGITRVSIGMQSAIPSVLATLDRTHDPDRVPQVVQWAKDAGLQVSLDLIYGTPGETVADVETSVRAALACEVDHLSAYSLIIEGNTAMARQLRRGEIEAPDPDDMADKYELVDDLTCEAGLTWYEVSNFARTPEHRSRHNLAYWKGGDWWGIGPGAHRHRDGLRSWNVKHPSRYARMLASGELPVADSEQVAAEDRLVERIMLELRIADGLAVDVVPEQNRSMLEVHRDRGHLDPDALAAGRAVLTREGRLLADAVIRDLVP